MKQVIEKFAKFYLKSDVDFLYFMDPKLIGYRSLEGQVYFNLNDIAKYISSREPIEYSDLRIIEFNQFYIIEYSVGDKRIACKLELKNNLITRFYETEIDPDLKRVKCIVQYDGSMYFGYQKQLNQTTIQSELEQALSHVLKEEITIHSSGRTDKGVHAYNQVIHFDTKSNIPPENIYKLINKHLPDSIHIKSSEEVHQTFHSRYDIQTKEYVYVINTDHYDVTKRNYEWFVPNLDQTRFRIELKRLIGTHDFYSFTKTTEKDTVRTIYSIIFKKTDTHLEVHIKGNGFLRYMIRNMIAYAVQVATNKTKLSLLDILEKRDNSIIKDIAPAGGLYMKEVTYLE